MEDSQNHNNTLISSFRYNDCWLVAHDKVYDVTEWAKKHPGGDMILLGGGKCLFSKRWRDGSTLRHRSCIHLNIK